MDIKTKAYPTDHEMSMIQESRKAGRSRASGRRRGRHGHNMVYAKNDLQELNDVGAARRRGKQNTPSCMSRSFSSRAAVRRRAAALRFPRSRATARYGAPGRPTIASGA